MTTLPPGWPLELLDLAVVKLVPSDTLKLTHCSGLQTPALRAVRLVGALLVEINDEDAR